MKSFRTSFSGWIEERIDLSGVKAFIQHKSVPKNRHSIWYYFGGVTLFLFIVQVISGILLLFYYRPGADTAFESIRFLMTKVEFGWLMRSVHSWSANLMVLAAAIHMFSVFLTKAYRKPREMTWVSGMLLFFLSLAFGFSGYLLPWNELAFFATKVGTDIAGSVPLVGEPIMELLRGGPDVGGATLSRFFGFHVALFPAIFTVLLAVHLLLVQKQGMSSPIGADAHGESATMPFFPNFVLRDLLLWLIVLNILAILAVFFPWELGVKADPFAPAPAGILPEWYFLFMFQILKLLPAHIWFIEGEVFGIMFFGVAGLLWMLVPFWDRASQRGQNNRLITYFGIFVILFILFFTILGWVMR
jgi:cytochrome b6